LDVGVSAPSVGAGRIGRLVLGEIALSWRFTGRDIRTNIIPQLLFTLAALSFIASWSTATILSALGWALLYFWLYSYVFCLPTQITGAEEDRINKPERPIPAGLVSARGAFLRWISVMIVYAGLGWFLGVLKWVLLWEAVTVMYAYGGLDRHWFTKNFVAMALGTTAQLGAAWELVTPLNPAAWRGVLVISVLAGVTALVQDFRDVEGDRATGRRTLPIAIGDGPARRVVITLFLLAPMALYWGVMPTEPSGAAAGCFAGLSLLALVIAGRLTLFRDRAADHQTYITYSYWYCLLLASMIIFV
jgi:4-hydroxybenzoate polyprenyltransferase